MRWGSMATKPTNPVTSYSPPNYQGTPIVTFFPYDAHAAFREHGGRVAPLTRMYASGLMSVRRKFEKLPGM